MRRNITIQRVPSILYKKNSFLYKKIKYYLTNQRKIQSVSLLGICKLWTVLCTKGRIGGKILIFTRPCGFDSMVDQETL